MAKGTYTAYMIHIFIVLLFQYLAIGLIAPVPEILLVYVGLGTGDFPACQFAPPSAGYLKMSS